MPTYKVRLKNGTETKIKLVSRYEKIGALTCFYIQDKISGEFVHSDLISEISEDEDAGSDPTFTPFAV